EALAGGGLTILAPEAKAFEGVTFPEELSDVQALLQYHVIGADLPAADFVQLRSVQSAAGGFMVVDTTGEAPRIDDGAAGAAIVYTDIMATSEDGSTVHLID